MARKPRLFIPGAIYHVYCRTARGERVFAAETEAEAFIATVRTIRDTDRFKILAWCLLGSHYHLVLQTSEVPLWSTMARLQGRVGRDFNRRHGFLGRLWQSRYKARVVDTQRYFAQVLAYVHLNPVEAGIVVDPSAFRWSGHSALLGRRPELLVNTTAALAGYGRTMSEARRHYLASIRAVAEARWFRAGLRNLPWWAEASDDQTIAKLQDSAGPVNFDGESTTPERPAIDLHELAGHCCRMQAVELADLAGCGRSARTIEARITLTTVAVQHFEHTVNAIALVLNKNPGTVSRWLGIARERQRVDATYRTKLEALSHSVVQLHNAVK